ncbi:MAG: DUF3034 family protein [Gammaproteobacteria bacterium]|nr:DUF3034 family protein [Gammaproteobacteria bacterium]
MRRSQLLMAVLAAVLAAPASAADGKILGTPGVMQVEGTGGTGVVPWAMLSGYDTAEQISATAFATDVQVDDFRLRVHGGALSIRDRVELSIARQALDVEPLATRIRQDVFGLKARVTGDLVYGPLPQISVGIQHKRLDDATIANMLGARDDTGTDIYAAASKLHLGGAFGYNWLWNLTARATRANQNGLLGHGGDNNNDYELMLEGSAAILLGRHLAVGLDYRFKPDNLSAVPEDHWADVFVAIFPNKHFNVTLAWVDLGNIAGSPDQRGIYFSVTGYLP